MPSFQQPCLPSHCLSTNRIHQKSPLRWPHLEQIRPNMRHAPTARTYSRCSRRGLGAGTPNPIQYSTTHTSNTHAEVSAITDTSAQSDLWSITDFLACRFLRADLLPVCLGLSAANSLPYRSRAHSLPSSQWNSTTARWHCAAPRFTSAALSKPRTYRTTHYSTLVSSPRSFPHSRPRICCRRGATQETLTLHMLTMSHHPSMLCGLSTTAATQQVTNPTSCAHALSL